MAPASLLRALLLKEVSTTAGQCLSKLTNIGVLFFAVLLNALISILNQMNSLYNQRPIIEKQAYVSRSFYLSNKIYFPSQYPKSI